MSDQLMKAMQSVSGAEAKCYVTLDGNRYNFMHAINIDAKYEKTKEEVPILGRRTKGNKAVGGKGSGSMEVHYNTSIMRRLAIRYMTTGEDFYFDTQVTNEDKTADIGRQTTILKDCNSDTITMALFDADATYLTETIDFTFESAEMPEEFDLLEGML